MTQGIDRTWKSLVGMQSSLVISSMKLMESTKEMTGTLVSHSHMLTEARWGHRGMQEAPWSAWGAQHFATLL